MTTSNTTPATVEPETPTETDEPNWLIPDKAYKVLKWIALTVLPALAILVGTLGPVWNLPNTDAIVTTIMAVSLFIGAVIGASELKNKYVNAA